MRHHLVAITIGLAATGSVVLTAPHSEASVPPITWLSTGDSYSAGEGVRGNEGVCAQSDDAWGPTASRLLRDDYDWNIDEIAFSACTGDLAENFYNPRVGDDAKPSTLWDWALEQAGSPASDRFDVITMSFGGNDIGFAEVIADCLAAPIHKYDTVPELLSDGGPFSPSRLTDLGSTLGADIIPFLGDDCDESESDLLQRVDWLFDPNECGVDGWRNGSRSEFDNYACEIVIDADAGVTGSMVDFWIHVVQNSVSDSGVLVVQGYPALFAESDQWGLRQGLRCNGVTRGDANMLGRVADHFDQSLEDGVDLANRILGSERIVYSSAVQLFEAGGHSLCGPGDDWINGSITITRDEPLFIRSSFRTVSLNPSFRFRHLGAFHPKAPGHQAEAEQVSRLLADRSGPSFSSTEETIDRAVFAGDWTGTVVGASTSFAADVVLTEENGRLAGTIRHPELPCEGTLTEIALTNDAIVLNPSYTAESNCIANGTHKLSLIDSDTLRYEWFHPTSGRVDSGEITRRPDPSDVETVEPSAPTVSTFTFNGPSRSTFSDTYFADVLSARQVGDFTVEIDFTASGASDLRRPETSCLVSDSGLVAVPLSTELRVDQPGSFAGTQTFPMIVPDNWSLRYSCRTDYSDATVGEISFPILGTSIFSNEYYAVVLSSDEDSSGNVDVRFASHGFTSRLAELREPSTSCLVADGEALLPIDTAYIDEEAGVYYNGTLVFSSPPPGPRSLIYSCENDYSAVALP